jgi:hypothetical protein
MLEFDEFVSILNSLFSLEVQRELILDRRSVLKGLQEADLISERFPKCTSKTIKARPFQR